MRTVVIPIFALLAACGGGSTANQVDGGVIACTEVGCGPPLTLRSGVLPISAEQIHSSTLTVCRNRQCLAQSFAGLTLPTSVNFSVATDFPDPTSRPYVTAFWTLVDGGYSLLVWYLPAPESNLVDGDVYDVTLTAGDGTILAATHQAVTYSAVQPNGPDCPPVCRVASGDF